MSIQIEKEIKTMLSQNDFNRLQSFFSLNSIEPIKQVNIYFDTLDQQLKKKKAAFRLRLFDNTSEWTIKQTQSELTAIEITKENDQRLDENIKLSKDILGSEISAFFEKEAIDIDQLEKTIQLTTLRWNIEVDDGLLALDQSTYYDQVDYELELETSNLVEGQIYLDKLLKQLDIPFQKADKKIARASKHAQNR
ncbi:CYTH domain-containing protein [Fundicoccus sp. Sow4_H7]|uniref:CYTH domain-containing protein n=1 Tax=Fundicoccus sp. Sow4_H7 TaxID=3438784 RepID=UPI003F9243E4